MGPRPPLGGLARPTGQPCFTQAPGPPEGQPPGRFPLAPLRSRASARDWSWSVREPANWRLGCNQEARPLLQWQLARGSPPPPPMLSCGPRVGGPAVACPRARVQGLRGLCPSSMSPSAFNQLVSGLPLCGPGAEHRGPSWLSGSRAALPRAPVNMYISQARTSGGLP